MMATSYTLAPGSARAVTLAGRPAHPSCCAAAPGTLSPVQTRYLLLLSVVTLFAILAASAVWFLMAG